MGGPDRSDDCAQARRSNASARVLSPARSRISYGSPSAGVRWAKSGSINSFASTKQEGSSRRPNSRSPASVSATGCGSPKLPKRHVMLSRVRLMSSQCVAAIALSPGGSEAMFAAKPLSAAYGFPTTRAVSSFSSSFFRAASSFSKTGQCWLSTSSTG